MEFRVIRELFNHGENGVEGFSLGSWYSNGTRTAYTLEDEDRHLELPGTEKVYGQTAIPRGRYRIVVDKSARFSAKAGHDVYLPHILDVPGYEGIRVHGGNRATDVLGCIAVGFARTKDGVANCTPAVQRIIDLIEQDADQGIDSWITIV